MKIAANLTRKPSFAARPARKMIGAKIFRARPRQSVPRGWIGS
jgi:hypothetical protein